MNKMLLALALVSVVGGFSSAADAKTKHKMSRSHAKKECLAENPGMAKSELKTCIDEKRNK